MSTYQVMPPLTSEERADLEQSIKAHGVLVPVLIDDGGEIIDGHHRVEIADSLGIDYVQITKAGTPTELRTLAYSLNLHRRHLSREQKRAVVEASLKADPQMSDREHGRRTGASHHTTAKARADLEAGGQLPTSPLRDNPQGRPQPATKPPVLSIDNTPEPAPDDGLTDFEAALATSSPDYAAATYRKALAGQLVRTSGLVGYEVDRVVETCDESLMRSIDESCGQILLWHERLIRARSGLRVLKGGHA